jgi:hypothetical protein
LALTKITSRKIRRIDMRILRYSTGKVKTPNGLEVLATGVIYNIDSLDFLVYKESDTDKIDLAIKIGPEDEYYMTGPLPEKFSFSNGDECHQCIWKAPDDIPEESLKGYWVIIFNITFGLEDIINEAILACGYLRGYKEGEKE